MNNVYIADCDNQIIGNQIQRLCLMADIQAPDLTRPTAEFIKQHFGSLPIQSMEQAFDHWLSGKLPNIKKPMKMNVHFISLILREYIEIFRHMIQFKPRKMLAMPKNEPTAEELSEQHRRSYELCYKDFQESMRGGTRLILYIMHLIGIRKIQEGNYQPLDADIIRETREWIDNYERQKTKAIKDSIGTKTIKAIAIQNNPIPEDRIPSIAICYRHFKNRYVGTEKSWY